MAGVLRTNETIGAPVNFVFQWKFSFIKKIWINKNRNFAWLKTEKIVTKPNLSQQIEIKSKRTPRSSTGGVSNVCIDGWLLSKKGIDGWLSINYIKSGYAATVICYYTLSVKTLFHLL